MRTFNLEDAEIEVIKDLRKLSAHEQRVFTSAIHRSAEEREAPEPRNGKIVPLVIPHK